MNYLRNIEWPPSMQILYGCKKQEGTIFVEARTVFENILKLVKASGKGEINQHAEIEPKSLKKLKHDVLLYLSWS